MSSAGTLGLIAYRVAGYLATPLINRKLRQRAKIGKEDSKRIGERLGRASKPRPVGPLVWVHAASVGESLAAYNLIERIHELYPALQFLLTTGTVTSANLVGPQLPPFVIHQFAPVDLPSVSRRFLDQWNPDAALFLESEFWPNLLLGLARRSIPSVLVNGRVSPDSHAKWSTLRPVISDLLSRFEICLAQSARDADFLLDLGARSVFTTGNIKDAAPPLSVDESVLRNAQSAIGERPCWVAASTHPGEETIVAQTHLALTRQIPDLLTIIVPRHQERGPAILHSLEEGGVQVALRSRGDEIDRDTSVYLADTMGEMGLWYRLCQIVFVGGSLVERGGQNPLEPARLSCALLFGPNMSNFEEISSDLVSCGAARRVSSSAELEGMLRELLLGPESCRAMLLAALDYSAKGGSAMSATMTHLEPVLSRIRFD